MRDAFFIINSNHFSITFDIPDICIIFPLIKHEKTNISHIYGPYINIHFMHDFSNRFRFRTSDSRFRINSVKQNLNVIVCHCATHSHMLISTRIHIEFRTLFHSMTLSTQKNRNIYGALAVSFFSTAHFFLSFSQ